MSLTDTPASDTRQQIERWIEDSQLLLGRIIPSVLDENQRLRDRAMGAEQDCDRLRDEVAALRGELGGLQSEVDALRGQQEDLRNERTAVADALARALHHMAQMTQPINEMVSKLHVAQPLRLEGALR